MKKTIAWILVAIASLLVCGAFIVGCGSIASSTNSAPVKTPAQSGTSQQAKESKKVTPEPTKPDTLKLGDTSSLGGWQMQVVSAKATMGGEYDGGSLKAGQIYLVVHVVAKNETGVSQTAFPMYMLTLKDSTGQSYTMGYVSTAQMPPTGAVANGEQVQGDITYIVPQNVHAFQYDFTPSFVDATTLTWTFQA
jgi:hypothetical protein